MVPAALKDYIMTTWAHHELVIMWGSDPILITEMGIVSLKTKQPGLKPGPHAHRGGDNGFILASVEVEARRMVKVDGSVLRVHGPM